MGEVGICARSGLRIIDLTTQPGADGERLSQTAQSIVARYQKQTGPQPKPKRRERPPLMTEHIAMEGETRQRARQKRTY